MHSAKVQRNELLDIVRQNKEKHIKEYEESVIDYKSLVLKITQDNLKLAKTGDLDKFKEIKYLPQQPQSYESSYIRAIRMLELSTEDVIEIDENSFNQLVLDEWDWKKNFTAMTTSYKVGSVK